MRCAHTGSAIMLDRRTYVSRDANLDTESHFKAGRTDEAGATLAVQ